jgi:hypothetical protein
MPRTKGQVGSIQGWFRQYFRDHPEAVGPRSNEEVVRQWKAAHPGQEFDKRVQGAMSNVKSDERKRLGNGRRKKKKAAAAASNAVAQKPARTGIGGGSLEHLELAIDRCLETARALESRDEDMIDVAKHLRAARNRVVWILGKP